MDSVCLCLFLRHHSNFSTEGPLGGCFDHTNEVIRSSFLSVSNLLRLSLCLFSVEARTYKRGCVRGVSSVVQTSHLCLPESSVSPIHLLGCSMPGAVLEPTNGSWILLVLTIISFLLFSFYSSVLLLLVLPFYCFIFRSVFFVLQKEYRSECVPLFVISFLRKGVRKGVERQMVWGVVFC